MDRTLDAINRRSAVPAAREVAALTPEERTTVQTALRWLTQSGIGTALVGARTVEQAQANAAVGDLPAIEDATLAQLARI